MSCKNDPNKAVLDYLTAQNRPYSTNDIFLNMHKELGKTAVQKALDLLVADGKVVEKINGKQKAYVISQENLPTASKQELTEFDELIKTKEAELKECLTEQKAAEASQRKLNEALTTEDAVAQIETLEKENESLKQKLAKLSAEAGDNVKLVSKEEKKKVETEHEARAKEWSKRKRMCLGVIDAIMESYPKSRKILFEEIGIETDEEFGVKIPDY